MVPSAAKPKIISKPQRHRTEDRRGAQGLNPIDPRVCALRAIMTSHPFFSHPICLHWLFWPASGPTASAPSHVPAGGHTEPPHGAGQYASLDRVVGGRQERIRIANSADARRDRFD